MLTKIVCGRDKSHPYKSRFVGTPYMASVTTQVTFERRTSKAGQLLSKH